MTPQAFIQAFEEFKDVSTNIISTRLAFAATRMGGPDFTVWPAFAVGTQPPSLTDMAQGYLAAHHISTSPFGGPTRLNPSKGGGKTSYLEAYEDLELTVAGGFLVAGVPAVANPSPLSGSLVLTPGFGTVAVTNGSTAITFQFPQTLAAGTLLVFISAQPGAIYALAFNVNNSTAGVLTAIYTGVTSGASTWNTGQA